MGFHEATWNFPLFSLLAPHRGNIWLLSQLADCGRWSGRFLSGLLYGATSSVDTSAGFSSLVGSSISCGEGGTPDSGTWVPASSSVMGAAGVSTWMGAPGSSFQEPLIRCCTLQDGVVGEDHIQFHHPPQFLNTPCQKVWSARHWWISLLCQILEGLHVGQSLLGLSLSKVLAGEHWVWKWQEFLLAEALGGWWC